MDHKLKEAWAVPLKVVQKLDVVNYQVAAEDGRGKAKMVHVNVLKKCVERDTPVRRLIVVADELDKITSGVTLKTKHEAYVEGDIEELKSRVCRCVAGRAGEYM